MSIRVTGSDWDVCVLRALEAAPPPPARAAEERHAHVVRLLVRTIGADLKLFLHCHGAAYLARWPHPSDPVVALVSWLARYYLCLHDVLRAGPRHAFPGWSEAVREAGALGDTARLVLTTQWGHALLLPLLLEEATGRPVFPIVHDRNPQVLDLYRRRLRLGEPLLLTRLGTPEIRRWLRSDGIVVANLDTCYPGTSRIRELPLFGARLHVPTGLLALATRRSLEVRIAAVPEVRGRPAPRVSARLPGDVDGALTAYADQLEEWVGALPEQWMAWGSLAR
ncbi:hypothetical protein ACFWIA_02620 [Streptomyces sp. NPDC127068]|uniref:hypothetical protein n=1 Tax=Streptomyces sp. NPDC127068 TaxID=3347127 RepID=UPI00364963AE